MHKYVINGFHFINSTSDREVFSASHLEDKTKKPEFYKFCIAESHPNLEILTNLVGVKVGDNVDVFCRAHKFFGRSKLTNLMKNNPCKDCVVQKKVALSNQKIIEELEEVRCKLPENISFDNQDALNAGIYGKPFLAKCSEHGVIETNRRLLKFSKYICKTCADIKCEHKNTVESKRKFLEYIENSNRDYDYSLVIFDSARKKVKIICKTHGVFLQTPRGHMKGYDCPKCGVSKALLKKVDLGYGNNFGRSSYTNLSGMSFVYVFKITSQTQGAPNSPSTYPAPFFSGTGTQAQFQWNNNQGLEVLDTDTGARVFAHAGDSLNIAVKNWQNDTWANFMVIILADNNQTIQAPI